MCAPFCEGQRKSTLMYSNGFSIIQMSMRSQYEIHAGLTSSPFPSPDFWQLSLDQDTADRNLRVSDDRRGAELLREKQPYPDHPGRFEGCRQLLCAERLSGRCYWELRWEGEVTVGVACRGLQRRGEPEACCLGRNAQSWSVHCSARGYEAWHGNRQLAALPPPPADSRKMAVYLDCSAGALSFFCFPTGRQRLHLHTFPATFAEPLHAAFGLGEPPEVQKEPRWAPSGVQLLHIEE